MTENNFSSEEDKKYIEGIIVKFNANKNDITLSVSEKALLHKILEAENKLIDINKQMIDLKSRLSHLQSQSTAFIDSLIALKHAEQKEK